MNSYLLEYLCDPVDKSLLTLTEAQYDPAGHIIDGKLISTGGRCYWIRDGIPRFESEQVQQQTVESFGDQWNRFNFSDFHQNWLQHTVQNTFGSTKAFSGKVVIDAGAGSGMQTKWIREAGAAKVIALELSHSVDGIMKDNLRGLDGVDVIQCSIDRPPIRDGAIDGIVICHNVIQHTRSVEETAKALWRVVGSGGEFVFNCYPMNDLGFIRKLRMEMYSKIRGFVSRRSFAFRIIYAHIMSLLRFLPLCGVVLEKSMLMTRGAVPAGARHITRMYKAGVINTFDSYGAHRYQHYKRDGEIQQLVRELQPDESKVLNSVAYFSRPQPIGMALRLQK